MLVDQGSIYVCSISTLATRNEKKKKERKREEYTKTIVTKFLLTNKTIVYTSGTSNCTLDHRVIICHKRYGLSREKIPMRSHSLAFPTHSRAQTRTIMCLGYGNRNHTDKQNISPIRGQRFLRFLRIA
ncbi:hypothetical protein K0M31_020492 [Melipona bicolor]|uniref:Uncharacterized protein n=1 Tax=Melipona bicolor TaxID=60889 RepID=A0AA40FK77_9HYME|nr:hypothetical protein K0M31_020492 [Melipona bicolor]